MSYFFNFLQLLCWVMVGYYLALHNVWAQVSFGLGAVLLGLISVMNDVSKELRKNGNTRKPKRS